MAPDARGKCLGALAQENAAPAALRGLVRIAIELFVIAVELLVAPIQLLLFAIEQLVVAIDLLGIAISCWPRQSGRLRVSQRFWLTL